MRGCVADPVEPGDFSQSAHEIAEPPFPAVRPFAVIGVDVLPEQRELARTQGQEPACLVEDLGCRARILGAAGVRHDAERAELVAAFLHGQKGAYPLFRSRLRQVVEFGLFRETGVDHSAATGLQRPRHQLR